jgi:hypothetical protein
MKLPTVLSNKQKKGMATGAIVLSTAFALLVIDDELNTIRGSMSSMREHMMATRRLSVDLGGGNCEWKEPLGDVPVDIDVENTVVVGFPAG